MGNRMRNNNNMRSNNNIRNNSSGERREEEPCHNEQRHVHELLGSVKIAEEEENPHNHRFSTVTEEAIPFGSNDHIHEVCFRTDFFEDHFHEFKGKTGGAIPVGNRHVHFIDSVTTVNDGHRHAFEAATLINDPIGEEGRHEHNEHRRNMNY